MIHTFLGLFVSLRLSDYLDTTGKSEVEVELGIGRASSMMTNSVLSDSPNEVYVHVKNIYYYVFSILASFVKNSRINWDS